MVYANYANINGGWIGQWEARPDESLEHTGCKGGDEVPFTVLYCWTKLIGTTGEFSPEAEWTHIGHTATLPPCRRVDATVGEITATCPTYQHKDLA